ncbi:hypothetical protein [Amycolatopsis regifaucium]|uniref:hypothetical protein n=1 Tax=Amycolatopsis regifaucium TaxID=546365 RepID=UPI001160BDAF|nr:hypothetical protein [Amycolatopsis regifaucium]
MITMQPVVEVYATDGFALWPVAEVGSFGYLALSVYAPRALFGIVCRYDKLRRSRPRHQRETVGFEPHRRVAHRRSTRSALRDHPAAGAAQHGRRPPGQFLSSTAQAFEILGAVDRENVLVLYDLYHSITMGNGRKAF